MSEWKPENLPIKKEVAELTDEFFKKTALEIEEIFTTKKEKPGMPRILFHKIMRKNGHEDMAVLVREFQKILDLFNVKDDEELKKLLTKKRNESMPWIKEDPDEENSPGKTIISDPKKPIFSESQIEKMKKEAYGHELRNKPPESIHNNEE